MAGSVNRQILLRSRPHGPASLDNFELTETPIPEPGEGEVLMILSTSFVSARSVGGQSGRRSACRGRRHGSDSDEVGTG